MKQKIGKERKEKKRMDKKRKDAKPHIYVYIYIHKTRPCPHYSTGKSHLDLDIDSEPGLDVTDVLSSSSDDVSDDPVRHFHLFRFDTERR